MTGAAPFVGNRFLGATWRGEPPPAPLSRLRSATRGWACTEGAGWLVASEHGSALARCRDTALAMTLDRALLGGFKLRSIAEVVESLAAQGSSVLSDAPAPFRAIWADAASGTVGACTDRYGLGQIFIGGGEDFRVIASSATLVADVLDAPLSAEALAGYATFGGFIGRETPFAGVRKLGARESASSSQGGLSIDLRTPPSTRPPPLTEAFRLAVTERLSAVPDAELELSGGLDSRLILGAMPRDARAGRAAITIGTEADPSSDVLVARDLAAREALSWSLLDVGGLARIGADELDVVVGRAAAGYDHMANPIDKIALILAGRDRVVGARFGGQNGEILRGFYYPGQPLGAAPSEALARRLIDWRLTTNDGVAVDVLSPAFGGELRAAAVARMTDMLMGFDGPWGRVLDQFYLEQRMQNWVGNSTGHRLMNHMPLYPFFDDRVVDAAMALPASDKLNSGAAYRLLRDIDPHLANIPLADGVVPGRVPRTSIGRFITSLGVDAGKAAGRLQRVLGRKRRATLGSQTIAQQWRALGLHARLPIEALARSGVFDERFLQAVATGQRLPDRPALGLLMLVSSLEGPR